MIHGKLVMMKTTPELKQLRKIQDKGPVQRIIDSEVIRRMDPYTPFRKGYLKGSPIRHTNFGSGEIVQETPYARRHYYNIGGATFQGAPMRGSHWFERMKADHRDSILRTAVEAAGGRSG